MEYTKIIELNYINTPVEIYGSYEELFFNAKAIGDILQINDVESKILNFDDHEYVNEFLTEQGLYKLMAQYADQQHINFKKWIYSSIKEVRLSRNKTYEPIVKTGHIYVLKTDAQTAYKVGKTKDVVKRVKGMQTGVLNDIRVLFDYKTSNPDLLEKCVHYILERYRSNPNREFFNCNLDYIKLIVNICGDVIDTLRSTYENITPDEVYTKLKEHNIVVRQKNTGANVFFKWLDQNIMYSDESNDYVDLQSVCKRYLKQSNVSSKITTLYKNQLDKYLSQTYSDKNLKYKQLKLKIDNTPFRPRGWSNLKFKH
jgi:ferritin